MPEIHKETRKLVQQCQMCHADIPESTASTREGSDYVWHICNTCYQKLKEQNNS